MLLCLSNMVDALIGRQKSHFFPDVTLYGSWSGVENSEKTRFPIGRRSVSQTKCRSKLAPDYLSFWGDRQAVLLVTTQNINPRKSQVESSRFQFLVLFGKLNFEYWSESTQRGFIAIYIILNIAISHQKFIPLLTEDLLLQQDNDTCHTSRSVQNFMEEEEVVQLLLNWPARSPDLNDIEHTRAYLKNKLSDRTLIDLDKLAIWWRRILQNFFYPCVLNWKQRSFFLFLKKSELQYFNDCNWQKSFHNNLIHQPKSENEAFGGAVSASRGFVTFLKRSRASMCWPLIELCNLHFPSQLCLNRSSVQNWGVQ